MPSYSMSSLVAVESNEESSAASTPSSPRDDAEYGSHVAPDGRDHTDIGDDMLTAEQIVAMYDQQNFQIDDRGQDDDDGPSADDIRTAEHILAVYDRRSSRTNDLGQENDDAPPVDHTTDISSHGVPPVDSLDEDARDDRFLPDDQSDDEGDTHRYAFFDAGVDNFAQAMLTRWYDQAEHMTEYDQQQFFAAISCSIADAQDHPSSEVRLLATAVQNIIDAARAENAHIRQRRQEIEEQWDREDRLEAEVQRAGQDLWVHAARYPGLRDAFDSSLDAWREQDQQGARAFESHRADCVAAASSEVRQTDMMAWYPGLPDHVRQPLTAFQVHLHREAWLSLSFQAALAQRQGRYSLLGDWDERRFAVSVTISGGYDRVSGFHSVVPYGIDLVEEIERNSFSFMAPKDDQSLEQKLAFVEVNCRVREMRLKLAWEALHAHSSHQFVWVQFQQHWLHEARQYLHTLVSTNHGGGLSDEDREKVLATMRFLYMVEFPWQEELGCQIANPDRRDVGIDVLMEQLRGLSADDWCRRAGCMEREETDLEE
ncbi:hypothetical protein Tdes44962_MAKER09791 [Teratosphaeria destructans]|uniref:Uncharacterized protein n=1 Tax=Teratosphaeria destructans TaxID=418781 RepID=A0A9W7SRM2_9PEZI|nr:hypothetical protein Tdes44962_MAKER09791 [Teratosphaeria destructans]